MKMKIVIMIVLLLAGSSSACVSKVQKQTPEPSRHPHYYPFTEVLGDYHLRFIVDHHEGEMVLVFEDFKEQPVKPVRYRRIKGKVTFPDGTEKKVTFLSETEICHRYCRRYYSRKYGYPRERGVFGLQAEWIKTAPLFALEVTVPFDGKDYKLTFQYEAPGGNIPYHSK